MNFRMQATMATFDSFHCSLNRRKKAYDATHSWLLLFPLGLMILWNAFVLLGLCTTDTTRSRETFPPPKR
jgi:hypothetical protein